jgi:hypothetical protein
MQRLLSVLYKHFPQVKGRVAYTDLGSPLTTDFYLGTAYGESCASLLLDPQ